jgi:hypothetical protein
MHHDCKFAVGDVNKSSNGHPCESNVWRVQWKWWVAYSRLAIIADTAKLVSSAPWSPKWSPRKNFNQERSQLCRLCGVWAQSLVLPLGAFSRSRQRTFQACSEIASS